MKKSEQTKRDLAVAFKELLEQMPFEKINVSDIATKTGLSRKSFYYHYRDKYDLVSGILEREFLQFHEGTEDKKWMEALCDYLYEHHDFYRKVMEYEGQNSFMEFMSACMSARIIKDAAVTKEEQLCAKMMADAMMAMLKCWLLQDELLSPQSFFDTMQLAAKQAHVLWE